MQGDFVKYRTLLQSHLEHSSGSIQVTHVHERVIQPRRGAEGRVTRMIRGIDSLSSERLALGLFNLLKQRLKRNTVAPSDKYPGRISSIETEVLCKIKDNGV